MYRGKEVCQGCGKPGSEIPRYVKTKLCTGCENVLKNGLSNIHNDNIEYVNVFQHYHAYRGKFLNRYLHVFLSAVNNPNKKENSSIKNIKHSFGSNGERYTIESRLYEPLVKLFDELEKIMNDIEKQIYSIPESVKKETDKVWDEIYNKGVRKGRDLLFQLNNNEITPDEFSSNLKCPKK